MSTKHRVVYSTDPKEKFDCPRCRKLLSDCICVPIENASPGTFTVNIRIEKSGRGGKIVTVLDDLPKNEAFLKSLSKELKVKCGTGGTYVLNKSESRIEIQGDKREQIKQVLVVKQIKYKGM